MKHVRLALVLIGLLVTGCAGPGPELRVMSFNIRYGTAEDGENRWALRRDLVAETIHEFDPDLLGTQEVLPFQAEFLRQALPEHEFIGVGRDNGRLEGEMTAIFFRRDRFELLDSGHFWLSETPDVPGSVSWDSALTRMASWVRLSDRRDDVHEFVFLNTHFDHRGETARLESARLLRRRAGEIAGDAPIIVTGDFNAPAQRGVDQPYAALMFEDGQPVFLDAYRIAHPRATREEGTFGGFHGDMDGPRIDWIFVSLQWRVLAASIDHHQDEGRWPSDHYPVHAVLRR